VAKPGGSAAPRCPEAGTRARAVTWPGQQRTGARRARPGAYKRGAVSSPSPPPPPPPGWVPAPPTFIPHPLGKHLQREACRRLLGLPARWRRAGYELKRTLPGGGRNGEAGLSSHPPGSGAEPVLDRAWGEGAGGGRGSAEAPPPPASRCRSPSFSGAGQVSAVRLHCGRASKRGTAGI
jgi:hypothetical protein